MTKLAVALLLALLAYTPAHAEGLFRMMEIKANSISAIPKWVDVVNRIRNEEPMYQNCLKDRESCKSDALRRWAEMIDEQRGQSVERQMRAVHAYLNRFPYITDQDLWGKSDYWATPKQFVDNSGDCEDYAIAKYISLKALGWPISNLRLAVVHDTVRDIPHAVLVVKFDGDYWVLDNLASSPLPHLRVYQYKPYYAVNENARWVFVKPLE